MLGAGWFAALSGVGLLSSVWAAPTQSVFAALLVVDVFVMLAGEFAVPHASEIAARAAKEITHGKYARLTWLGSVAIGHIVPIGLVAVDHALAPVVAALCATVGLYCYEYAFVMAPQEIPNS